MYKNVLGLRFILSWHGWGLDEIFGKEFFFFLRECLKNKWALDVVYVLGLLE